MIKKHEKAGNTVGEKTVVKTLGFLGETGTGGHAAMIDVKNGKILRIRPLQYTARYKAEEVQPWQIEAHGKIFQSPLKTLLPPHSLGYKKRVYSPNRILYPLKRVDWSPGGERNTANRGKSGYVRISWEEALELVAGEINRIKKQYGTPAILCQSDGHGETKIVHPAHACNVLLLNHLGGYTLQTRNPDSWEGWYWGAKHAWGMEPVGIESQGHIIPDIAKNSELLLFWGCDPETTAWGWGGQITSPLCYWFTELGIKSIYICPDLNYGAAVHADKWIPVLPNTDAALRLAIAYVWITTGTYDKEYVATHTYGLYKFEEYVLGKDDGIPKTPGWAAEKTGVPSRIIKALAREWAAKRTSAVHVMGGGSIRGAYSTESARLEICLLAMQGVGKPGVHQFAIGVVIWDKPPKSQGMPMPMYVYRGTAIPQQAALCHGESMEEFTAKWKQVGWTVPPVTTLHDGKPGEERTVKQIIAKNLIHEAILNPPVSWYGTTLWAEPIEDQFVKYTYPAKGFPEIHMIWTDSPCWITCWNDGNRQVEALRSPKIEFVLAQHPWLENDCLFADVILPSNTKFEELDIGVDIAGGQVDSMFYEEKCVEPVGESRSDYEIVCDIAEKMGLRDKVTGGRSVEEWIKMGFDNSGMARFINYEEFKEADYFVVPPNPDWKPGKPALQNFYEDPEKYPLKTPSGKIEFYSQNLAKYFPDDRERPPVPHWIEKGESHDERLSSPRAKKYPLLVISNHGRWRVHAQLDDINWFKEATTGKVRGVDGYLYEPIWINPFDAKKRGIANGDVVKVFNERGGVLVGAYVTERIMPGVVSIDHGARYDPIVPGELDRGGAINTITPRNLTSKNATGMAVCGFLAEVERVDLNELQKKYPEAFSRPYHPGAGLRMERVLHKE